MTSAAVRDPLADHLLTPDNSTFLFIDYQPAQLVSVPSMDHALLMKNANHEPTRIAPVLNRHDTRARRRDLNRGNPILAPRRFPDLLADHCFRPRASASSPEL